MREKNLSTLTAPERQTAKKGSMFLAVVNIVVGLVSSIGLYIALFGKVFPNPMVIQGEDIYTTEFGEAVEKLILGLISLCMLLRSIAKLLFWKYGRRVVKLAKNMREISCLVIIIPLLTIIAGIWVVVTSAFFLWPVSPVIAGLLMTVNLSVAVLFISYIANNF